MQFLSILSSKGVTVKMPWVGLTNQRQATQAFNTKMTLADTVSILQCSWPIYITLHWYEGGCAGTPASIKF